MNGQLQLVECPRDAMQGWKKMIPTRDKVNYINALLRVGFHTVDFGSFVSPKLVPQMADTADVISKLEPSSTHLLAIIANVRGAEEAIKFNQICYLGFPFSVSPTFQYRNTNSSPDESMQRLEEIQRLCEQNGKELVVYLSMGFGNPYEDEFSNSILHAWMTKIRALGVRTMSVADTVGVASPSTVKEVMKSAVAMFPGDVIGVHLHSTPQFLYEKLSAAYDAGCRRFDGAIGGIGGCPMANDELVGNMDTLAMLSFFRSKGYCGEIDTDALNYAVELSHEIFR